MAIENTVCASFKLEQTQKLHDCINDTLKIALYIDGATLNADTTTYATAFEVEGTGYTAGGVTLTNVTTALDGTTVVYDFDDPIWAGATFTTRGALIYNSSVSNKAIAVIDFLGDFPTAGGSFKIQLPPATASTAIIQHQ